MSAFRPLYVLESINKKIALLELLFLYFFLYDGMQINNNKLFSWMNIAIGCSVKNKKLVTERLDQLKVESGLSDKHFKSTLASITGKTPRTIRRWYSLENNIHESDIDRIAKHFGKHVHWLRYGDRRNISTAVDQIMSSDHFGAIVLKDDQVEEVNFKLTEMMGLFDKDISKENICDYILNLQSDETIQQCKLGQEHAITHGAHVDQMIMVLGDDKKHFIEATILHLNNNRILRILFDKGLVESPADELPSTPSQTNSDEESKLNILFVDDDIALCQLYNSMLSIHNYNLTAYTNSLQAFNEYRKNHEHYDLLISDIIMPDMTGDKLAAECRKITPDLPVILCSGYADHLNKSTAEEFEVSHYLQKPIDSSKLLSILDKISQSLPLT